MTETKRESVNPETGRTTSGRFAKGNSFGKKPKSPREITSAIRAIAADNKVTEKALKTLLAVIDNKDGKATVNEQIKAAQFLMTQFTVSADKDRDAEVTESATASLSEMLNTINKAGK